MSTVTVLCDTCEKQHKVDATSFICGRPIHSVTRVSVNASSGLPEYYFACTNPSGKQFDFTSACLAKLYMKLAKQAYGNVTPVQFRCFDCSGPNDDYMVFREVWGQAWPEYEDLKAEQAKRHLYLCYTCL